MNVYLRFRSNSHALDIYATSPERAEIALREYLNDYHGGLAMSVLADADEYYSTPCSDRGAERVEVLFDDGSVFEARDAVAWTYLDAACL